MVGGFNHLEKYEFVNGKDYPFFSVENNTCSKPPTSGLSDFAVGLDFLQSCWQPNLCKSQLFGDGSKPWYLVNPKIAGKWMFIPLKCIYRY